MDQGECLCISGPSGSGKTRLLRTIADLDMHEGRAFLDGVACDDFRPADWRCHVGLLLSESQWWKDRVGEHFNDHLGTEQLSALGLAPSLMDQAVNRLSSGERQRLALLRLLANRPQVLLLDEPTANLDPENGQRVETLLSRYQAETGATLLWVSHDPAQIGRVATRHMRMAQGLLSEGPEIRP